MYNDKKIRIIATSNDTADIKVLVGDTDISDQVTEVIIDPISPFGLITATIKAQVDVDLLLPEDMTSKSCLLVGPVQEMPFGPMGSLVRGRFETVVVNGKPMESSFIPLTKGEGG